LEDFPKSSTTARETNEAQTLEFDVQDRTFANGSSAIQGNALTLENLDLPFRELVARNHAFWAYLPLLSR
jgi:hypothetical protein